MLRQEVDRGVEMPRGVVVNASQGQAFADQGFTRQLQGRIWMNQPGDGVMPARSQPANSISDHRGAAGDLDDDIGRVGFDRVLGGRQDGDSAKLRYRQESGRLAIDNEHLFPAGSL